MPLWWPGDMQTPSGGSNIQRRGDQGLRPLSKIAASTSCNEVTPALHDMAVSLHCEVEVLDEEYNFQVKLFYRITKIYLSYVKCFMPLLSSLNRIMPLRRCTEDTLTTETVVVVVVVVVAAAAAAVARSKQPRLVLLQDQEPPVMNRSPSADIEMDLTD
jgi:hypothetical protein